jgi:RND superfamily putative drug exporter
VSTLTREVRAVRPPGRYGRLVAGRRSKWAVLAIWLVLMAVGGSLAAKLGSVQDNDPVSWLPANAQSTKAVEVAEKHFADKDLSTAVVVYSREGGLTAADLAKIEKDRGALKASAVTVSGDRKAAFIGVPVRTAKNDNGVLADGVDRVRDLTGAGVPGGLQVKVTGEAGTVADFIAVYSGLDGVLLGVTLAIVALLLLVTYRSPVLWLIPLLAVGLAAQVAMAVVYLLAKHAGLAVDGQSAYILTVLALGVGTDYALLLIARYREELHRYRDRHEAMAHAVRGCLPAVAASAGTVCVATLCLVFGSLNSTRGLGPVVAIGVTVVFAAMVSLLPALLVILGRWVFWPLIPRYADSFERGTGLWARVARTVGRAPRPIWIGAALVLVALAFGSSGLSTGLTQADQFTKKVDSVTGQETLARHFPAGSSAPADLYVPDGEAAAALSTVQKVPGVSSAAQAGASGGWTHVSVVLAATPETAAARQTVERVRTALDHAGARSAVVGGESAVALDRSNAQGDEERLLIPLILGIVLLMLIALLRSVVAPLVLLGSVVLSYASAVGAAALLFRALGHPQIDRGLLLFGFLFLVALGIDYTIFLMTRVREEVPRLGHREGVLTGLTVTGGVITSAGLVLAGTFTMLAVVPTVGALQQGLIVAVGVLLDTFVVRSLLVPALALEVGPRIWWPTRGIRA